MEVTGGTITVSVFTTSGRMVGCGRNTLSTLVDVTTTISVCIKSSLTVAPMTGRCPEHTGGEVSTIGTASGVVIGGLNVYGLGMRNVLLASFRVRNRSL